jgi:hypothetical protein
MEETIWKIILLYTNIHGFNCDFDIGSNGNDNKIKGQPLLIHSNNSFGDSCHTGEQVHYMNHLTDSSQSPYDANYLNILFTIGSVQIE